MSSPIRLNEPLFLALRDKFGIHVPSRCTDLEDYLKGKKVVCYTNYDDHKWDVMHCPKDVVCRLTEDNAYIKTGEKILKISLPSQELLTHELFDLELRVLETDYFPSAGGESDEISGNVFYCHDKEGTHAMTWEWSEDVVTTEERKVLLRDFIGTVIPEGHGLTNYRLCSVSPASTPKMHVPFIASKNQKTESFEMHAFLGYLLSTTGLTHEITHVTTGYVYTVNSDFGNKILGFYEGDRKYALCFTPEGFNIVFSM